MKIKSKLYRLIKNNSINICIIVSIILTGIIFIILNKYTNMEEFSPLSIEYKTEKATSRNKLQFMIDEYESSDMCNQGYIQPTTYI